MTNKAKILRILGVGTALVGFVLITGSMSEVNAQRDPFSKPGWARQRDNVGGAGGAKGVKKSPTDLGVPMIEQRVDYYKRLRESAAASGTPVPKVTSVLTLNEMAVTGIFHTPRGYAAIVEAVPLRLSYTIYPGEKFFDGQLVAVEENRLVFRRVTKMSNGKFISSVENKALRKYTDREQIQGTAPVQSDNRASAEPSNAPVMGDTQVAAKPAGPIVSPLEEMNRQVAPAAAAEKKEASKKDAKKPAKLAKSR
jgi:hypothetical protein